MTLSASHWHFLALSFGPGLAVAGLLSLVWLLPDHRVEVSAVKAGIALVIGPTAGIVMHHVCIPTDNAAPTEEQRIETWRLAAMQDAARWRRVVLVTAATLTIGVVLS